MNLGDSFSRTPWSKVFQRFFPDASEGVHEKPAILWEGNKFAFLNIEDKRSPSVSIAGNFGEVLQTKNSLQAKNAHQNQIKCNEGYQICMLNIYSAHWFPDWPAKYQRSALQIWPGGNAGQEWLQTIPNSYSRRIYLSCFEVF